MKQEFSDDDDEHPTTMISSKQPTPEQARLELSRDPAADLVRHSALYAPPILHRASLNHLAEEFLEPPAESYTAVDQSQPAKLALAKHVPFRMQQTVTVNRHPQLLNSAASTLEQVEELRATAMSSPPEFDLSNSTRSARARVVLDEADLKVGITSARRLNMAACLSAAVYPREESATLCVADLRSLYENTDPPEPVSNELLTRLVTPKLGKYCAPAESVQECIQLEADQIEPSAPEHNNALKSIESNRLEPSARVSIALNRAAPASAEFNEETCDKLTVRKALIERIISQREPDSLLSQIQAIRQRILSMSVQEQRTVENEFTSHLVPDSPDSAQANVNKEPNPLTLSVDKVELIRARSMPRVHPVPDMFDHSTFNLTLNQPAEHNPVLVYEQSELSTGAELVAERIRLLNAPHYELMPEIAKEKTELIRSHDVDLQELTISQVEQDAAIEQAKVKRKPRVIQKEIEQHLPDIFRERVNTWENEEMQAVIKASIQRVSSELTDNVPSLDRIRLLNAPRAEPAPETCNEQAEFIKLELELESGLGLKTLKIDKQQADQLDKVQVDKRPIVVCKQVESLVPELVEKSEALLYCELASPVTACVEKVANDLSVLTSIGLKPRELAREELRVFEYKWQDGCTAANINNEQQHTEKAELISEPSSGLIASSALDKTLQLWLHWPEINLAVANDQKAINIDEKLDLLYEQICVQKQASLVDAVSSKDLVSVEKVLSLLLPSQDQVEFKSEQVSYLKAPHLYQPVENLRPAREPYYSNSIVNVSEPPATACFTKCETIQCSCCCFEQDSIEELEPSEATTANFVRVRAVSDSVSTVNVNNRCASSGSIEIALLHRAHAEQHSCNFVRHVSEECCFSSSQNRACTKIVQDFNKQCDFCPSPYLSHSNYETPVKQIEFEGYLGNENERRVVNKVHIYIYIYI